MLSLQPGLRLSDLSGAFGGDGLIDTTSNPGAGVARDAGDCARPLVAVAMPTATGPGNCSHGGRGEQQFPGCVQRPGQPAAHNALHALLEIAARHPRHAWQRRLQIILARLQDALGVHLGVAAQTQHAFIAGTLPLIHQPGPDPPQQRMKPEDGLHQHVNRAGQIVAPPHVA